nr:hypothetical protein [Tanacetum cinerariifolium]
MSFRLESLWVTIGRYGVSVFALTKDHEGNVRTKSHLNDVGITTAHIDVNTTLIKNIVRRYGVSVFALTKDHEGNVRTKSHLNDVGITTAHIDVNTTLINTKKLLLLKLKLRYSRTSREYTKCLLLLVEFKTAGTKKLMLLLEVKTVSNKLLLLSKVKTAQRNTLSVTTAGTRVKTASESYYYQYKEVIAAQVEVTLLKNFKGIY